MRILQVIPTLDTGGAQKLLEDLIPLIKRGNEIRVVVYQKTGSPIEKHIEESGVPVYNLGISKRSPKAIFRLRKFIKDTDIVQLHLFPNQYFAWIANLGLHKPLVFTEHSTFNKRRNHKFLRKIEKRIYGKMNKVVCISDAVRKSLIHWLEIQQGDSKCEVISNGINLHEFISAIPQDPEKLFGRKGIPILMISRFTDSKDHETVVRALPHIKNKDVFMVFVGDGENKKRIENMATECGLKGSIIFLGQREDVPILIKSAKLGIQSSHWEGFGLSALEMMAGGLPVLASDVKGLKDIIRDQDLLFEKGNERDLANKINRILDDEGYYEEKKIQCQYNSRDFDIKNTASKYLSLYEALSAINLS